jgi:hypothetical protein
MDYLLKFFWLHFSVTVAAHSEGGGKPFMRDLAGRYLADIHASKSALAQPKLCAFTFYKEWNLALTREMTPK